MKYVEESHDYLLQQIDVMNWYKMAGDFLTLTEEDAEGKLKSLEKFYSFLREEIDEVGEQLEKLKMSGYLPVEYHKLGKEMADALWCLLGLANYLEMDLGKYFDAVYISNMSKFTNGVERDEKGKIMKGSAYEKPDFFHWSSPLD